MRASKLKNLNTYFIGSFLLLILLWQFSIEAGWIKEVYFGSPLGIIGEFTAVTSEEGLLEHFVLSMGVYLIGLFAAVASGLFLGIIFGSNNKIYRGFSPYIYFLNSVPVVVLLPMIIIWLGMTPIAKLVIIFSMSVVPVLLNVMEATHQIPHDILRMAKSFRIPAHKIRSEIFLKSSMANFFVGTKIAVGRAMIGLIIAEFSGLGMGIGYYISFYASTFQTNKVWLIIFAVALINAIILKIVERIEKNVIYWR